VEPKIGVGFGILLLKEGKVLLGKRHDDPAKASSALHGEGTWTMPGGKLHYGESFLDGARRELREETGMELVGVEVISLSNDRVHDAQFVTIGLLCDAHGEPAVLEPDEITEWQWFSLDHLPKPIFFASENILRNYRNKTFYS
jgi:8-oxo-dGTP diphosphatase